MWSNNDNNFPANGFLTPPACWKSPHSVAVAMPLSERKSNAPSSGCIRDLFHVVHKVPSGDSPYVRAKHVQLIDKDPSKAISLFWAAINAGDRVDSALKDMAVVMKQLNRSDEAIEAIKSFRHLCPFESQESIDNVLVELYKRSGRIEEEIEILQRKLKNIGEDIAFGGKRTKTARSQGKKIQITVEQERSRILGNLAWAYLQHHDYGLAENFYRKALALEPDNNKKCNLAICLMHMNRIPEAKSLLQGVKASYKTKEMDDSCAKSFERAVQMLTEIESKSALKPAGDDEWTKSNYVEGSTVKSNILSNKMQESPIGSTRKEVQTTPILYTQPRKVSWTRCEGGDQKRRSCEEDEKKRPSENVMVHTIRNLNGELKSDAAASKSESINMLSSHERNWRQPSWTNGAQRKKSTGAAAMVEPILRPRMGRQRNYDWEHSYRMISGSKDESLISNNGGLSNSDVSVSSQVKTVNEVGDMEGKQWLTKCSSQTSWADMVEEEEERRLLTGDLSPCFNYWNLEESNNENLDSNMDHQSPSSAKSPTEIRSRGPSTFDLKHNSNSLNDAPTRNRSVRRSLWFEGTKGLNMKKKRLQVFRDITPSQDSP